MNNKRLGTAFERMVCELLAQDGYWVHFISPDARGAQPFDIIAAKNGRALAIDCKTCAAASISIKRLEDNQIMAFERWLACGNDMPIVAVLHNEQVYWIRYDDLKSKKSIRLQGGCYEGIEGAICGH